MSRWTRLAERLGFAAPPRDYLFIITYGRSGSTLLMGLINSLPGFCIRGENNNALYGLFEFQRRLTAIPHDSLKNSERPTHPWFGAKVIDPATVRATIRDAFTRGVLMPEGHHRTIGFKEIRFSQAEVPLFADYIAFIQQTFAPARIVFNHRRPDDVARSGWWARMPTALRDVTFMEERFLTIPAGPGVYHFSYDGFLADPDSARGLMDFLGQPFDPAAVRKLLDTRYSY